MVSPDVWEPSEGEFIQAVNIISSLELVVPFLSVEEKKLGNYVLTYSQEILSLTLKNFSLQAKVNKATVAQFTCKLDCEGYSDFKLSLSANLPINFYNRNSDTIPDKAMPTDTLDSVLKKPSAFIITSIRSTTDIIDSQELDKMTRLIRGINKHKHKIYPSGLDASSTLVEQLQIKFIQLDIPVIYYEDVHLQLESNLNTTEGDLLICFTALGKSVQSHQYINITNQKKAKIILIIQYGNQELASKATVTLFVSTVENNLRPASYTALTVQPPIADTLFLSLTFDNLLEVQEGMAEKNRIFSELGHNMNDYK